MFLYIILLIAGMVLLIKGADFFVDGSSAIAKALKIPSLVIGLTLVSMGTSAPEASVSIQSSIQNLNDLSIGNIIGSNIFNTFFILGVSSLVFPLSFGKEIKKYDIPIMVGIYCLLIVFLFLITPLVLDLFEAITLLVLFVGYMAFMIIRSRKSKDSNKTEEIKKKEKPLWLNIILACLGLAGIIFGGNLVVENAAAIALEIGMSESLVGLTIVAVGTSLPELTTSIVASIKKEDDIAIGNVVGSNIFNIVFILGVSSTISPLVIESSALVDLLVMAASGIAIMLISIFSEKLRRWQGILLTIAYIAYLTFIILRN